MYSRVPAAEAHTTHTTHGHHTITTQALRREMATTKAAAGGLPSEALRLLQPLFEQHAGMRQEYDALHSRFDLESTQRRQLYNRLMEYQGNIRVFCRCRPMLTREVCPPAPGCGLGWLLGVCSRVAPGCGLG